MILTHIHCHVYVKEAIDLPRTILYMKNMNGRKNVAPNVAVFIARASSVAKRSIE